MPGAAAGRAAALPLRRHWRRPGMGASRARVPEHRAAAAPGLHWAVRGRPLVTGCAPPAPPRAPPAALVGCARRPSPAARWFVARGEGRASRPPRGWGWSWSQRGLGPGRDITADAATCWMQRWGTDPQAWTRRPLSLRGPRAPARPGREQGPRGAQPRSPPTQPNLPVDPAPGPLGLTPFSCKPETSLYRPPRGRQHRRVLLRDKAGRGSFHRGVAVGAGWEHGLGWNSGVRPEHWTEPEPQGQPSRRNDATLGPAGPPPPPPGRTSGPRPGAPHHLGS